MLESPRVTNWGVWGGWAECKTGEYVVGMQLKTERPQGNGDDTALNAIRLLCALPGSREYSPIQSLEGPWGNFGRTSYCPENSTVSGFQLRSESEQGNGDDTAANNLRLICRYDNGDRQVTIEGDGNDWGDWTESQRCLPGQNVCGFRTQVEASLGGMQLKYKIYTCIQ